MKTIKEIFQQLKNKNKLKIIFGFLLIIVGLILHLIPLFPAGWIIVAGLEFLGIRLLLQDKIKDKFGNYKIFNKLK